MARSREAQERCQFRRRDPLVGRVLENRSVLDAQTLAARGSTQTEGDLEREVGLLARVGYCITPTFSANGDRVA